MNRIRMLGLLVFIPLIILLSSPVFGLTYTVTTTADSGTGSLRWAINSANGNPGADLIEFNIPTSEAIAGYWGAYYWSIYSQSLLKITDTVTIDGTSQPTEGMYVNSYGPEIEVKGWINYVGIFVDANNCTIKGLTVNRCSHGIYLDSNGNKILGCYLGTDVTGTMKVANAGNGLRLWASNNNEIGDGTVANRNIISGNDGHGISLATYSENNKILGNYIGKSYSFEGLGNGGSGIVMDNGSENNEIGDGTVGGKNFISDNNGHGIAITNSGSGYNIILGNEIKNNKQDGIYIVSSSNKIGNGAASGSNNISHNQLRGIRITGTYAKFNTISNNSISSNSELGILLLSGANDGIVPPKILNAHYRGSNNSTYLVGEATPESTIEIFISDDDPFGYGEGVTFVVSSETSLSGIWSVSFEGFTEGTTFTATATDKGGNTSEFSLNKDSVALTSNPLDHFVIKIPHIAKSGVGFLSQIEAKDSSGNTTTMVSGTTSLNVDSGSITPSSLAYTDFTDDGVWVGLITLDTIGSRTVTVINGSATDNSNVQVYPQNNFIVTTTVESGPGSLRQAMMDANVYPGACTVVFNIPTSEASHENDYHWWSIKPTSPLPDLTGNIEVRGSSQPTNEIYNPYGPVIEIDGSLSSGNGININGDSNTVEGLVVNRFSSNGIRIAGDNHNVIVGCYIGTNVTGEVDLGNSVHGIYVQNGDYNKIGNLMPQGRNLISGNDQNGVFLDDASENEVFGNYIGTNKSGITALKNSFSGIRIEGYSESNRIGNDTSQGRNVISGNNQKGIDIFGYDNTSNEVLGNYIGTDASGEQDLGNSQEGIKIEYASFNLIQRNTIAGNSDYGIKIYQSKENKVYDNYIGTDKDGEVAIPNQVGVWLENNSNNNKIGNDSGGGNVISGNISTGLIISWDSSSNEVYGNIIGLNASGTSVVGNDYYGISISSGSGVCEFNKIGSGTTGGRNVISGNGEEGIYSYGNHTSILGNYIGTDITGLIAFGNWTATPEPYERPSAVSIIGRYNKVGDGTSGGRNVISGNYGEGIRISNLYNEVLGNYIGTDSTGSSELGNSGSGIRVTNRNNKIGNGSAGGANRIWWNKQNGISVEGFSSDYITISVNSIFSNEALGILLAPGSNGDIPAPLISSAQYYTSSGLTQLLGAATPESTVEVFISDEDSSGAGEGKTYVDSAGTSIIPLWYRIVDGLDRNTVLTATVTDKNGNTSEFSLNKAVDVANLEYLDVSAPPSVEVNEPFTMTVTAKDGSGNPTTEVLAQVTLSANPGSIEPTSIPADEFTDDGVWTGIATLSAVGSVKVTANNGFPVAAITGSTEVLVFAGPVDHFDIYAPATAIAGQPFGVSIEAKDAGNNTTIDISGITSLSADSGSIDPSTIEEAQFTDDGMWYGSVTLDTAGSRTIYVTNGDATGSKEVTVLTDAATFEFPSLGVTIYIPAGAAAEEVSIDVSEVSLPDDPPAGYGMAGIIIDFISNVTNFDLPITVTMQLETDPNMTDYTIYYWNGSAWSSDGITVIEVTDTTITFTTTHLTIFVPFGIEHGTEARFGPSPFDPDKDPYGRFWYWLTEDEDTKIYIVDLSGSIIWKKEFSAGAMGGKQGENRVDWDGKNDWGSKVADGVYLYKIIQGEKVIAQGKIAIIRK